MKETPGATASGCHPIDRRIRPVSCRINRGVNGLESTEWAHFMNRCAPGLTCPAFSSPIESAVIRKVLYTRMQYSRGARALNAALHVRASVQGVHDRAEPRPGVKEAWVGEDSVMIKLSKIGSVMGSQRHSWTNAALHVRPSAQGVRDGAEPRLDVKRAVGRRIGEGSAVIKISRKVSMMGSQLHSRTNARG